MEEEQNWAVISLEKGHKCQKEHKYHIYIYYTVYRMSMHKSATTVSKPEHRSFPLKDASV